MVYLPHLCQKLKTLVHLILDTEGTTDSPTCGDTSHKCESIQKHLRLKTFRLEQFKIPLQALKVRTSIKVGLGPGLSGREGPKCIVSKLRDRSVTRLNVCDKSCYF